MNKLKNLTIELDDEKFTNVGDMVEHIFDVMNMLNDNGFHNGIFVKMVELGDITLHLRIDYYGADIANYDRDFEKANDIDKFDTTIFLNDGYEEAVKLVTRLVEAIKG